MARPTMTPERIMAELRDAQGTLAGVLLDANKAAFGRTISAAKHAFEAIDEAMSEFEQEAAAQEAGQ